MDRPTRRKARLALAIVAALVVLPVPAATAAAPADDEYVLELPGVSPTDNNLSQTAAHDGNGVAGGGSGTQRGVVGETDAPPTPLAAAGDALAALPASLLVGAALLLATAILAAAARRRRPSTC
jgi:hypothetical protein